MAETSISSRNQVGYADAGEARIAPSVKDKAYEEASALATKAKDAASCTVQKTKDVASSVVQQVEDMASTIGHKAEGAVDSVGGGMKSLAGSIRDKAPENGVLGNAASGVAGTLESGGAYLQEQNLRGMAEDATSLIRRYPLQAILVGVGVGFLVARALRR
jgi:ElaB/YqjD/DUF883 family membrane-anchored ribosome-binding protein